jgi:hypothetical protein
MGYPRGRTSSLLVKMRKLVSDYTISYPQRFIILTWIIGISRGSIRIWGCERVDARSHPQIRGFTTAIPREPLTCSCGFGVELYTIWEPSLNILSCISSKAWRIPHGHLDFPRKYLRQFLKSHSSGLR